jgi:hypothetical protein
MLLSMSARLWWLVTCCLLSAHMALTSCSIGDSGINYVALKLVKSSYILF